MILLIDKPTGISSFDVIRILRRTKIEPGGKKIKMGHAGTLDPLASGLMIIATEADTKRIEEFMGLPKEYECELEFGKRSISGDADGEMSEGNLRDISREEFEEVLQRFIGTIEQRPPQTSAVKIGGKRAYKLAREGKIIEMPVRQVHIFSIEILVWKWPRVQLRVKCAKGTYIRSLAIDLGEAVGGSGANVIGAENLRHKAAAGKKQAVKSGCGAYLTALRRTAIGQYRVEDAEKLPQEEVEHLRARFGQRK